MEIFLKIRIGVAFLVIGTFLATPFVFTKPTVVFAVTCGFGSDIGGGQCRGFLTSGTSWTVPSDWNASSNTIEVIGGGAGGRSYGGSVRGGGGGGGGYSAQTNVTLTPGGSVTYSIGAGGAANTAGGDTYFCNSTSNCASIAGSAVQVGAKGGAVATSNGTVGGVGGQSGSGVGATKFSGGTGGDTSFPGAGGGGAAGPNGAGADGGDASLNTTGGGGANGGTAGVSPGDGTPTAGGNNRLGSGAGAGGSPGAAGTNGGGGGGGAFQFNGGAGSQDAIWVTAGPGGGGGAGADEATGGTGGTYGGGGGGGGGSGGGAGAPGASGIVVITYAPVSSGGVLGKPPNNLGLVGYWAYNEATSTQATDFSGKGGQGTFVNIATPPTTTSGWTANGRRGGALLFDGTNDYISVPDSNSLDVGDVFTIALWVKRASLNNNACVETVVAKGQTGGFGIDILNTGCGTEGKVQLCFNLVGCVVESSVPIADTNWHHIAVTKNGTTRAMYIDGVDATTLLTNSTGQNTTEPFIVGVDFGAGNPYAGTYYKGAVDDVRLYNRPLGAAEVSLLYARGTSGAVRLNASSKTLTDGTTLGSANGLNGLWTFDGGDALWSSTMGTFYDGSGNNNYGTSSGMSPTSAAVIGKLGQAVSFDGVDDRVTIPYTAALCPASISISSWVYFNSMITTTVSGGATVNEQYIYGKEHGNGFQNAYNLYKGNGPATLHFDIFTGDAESTTAVVAGTWYHVLGTYDGTNIRLYINGVLERTVAYGTGYTCSTDALVIGNRGIDVGGIYDAYFNGRMDDFRIYNRALTDAEAKELYNLGVLKIRP